jgi:hypothetical protein
MPARAFYLPLGMDVEADCAAPHADPTAGALNHPAAAAASEK